MNRQRLLGCTVVLGGAITCCSGAGHDKSTSSSGAGASGAGAAGGAGAGSGGDQWAGPISTHASLRKVKNVLTGLAPTDAEIAAVQSGGATALKSLIDTWMGTPEYQGKMLGFFADAFQQSSLTVLNFEFQLRMRPGALDLPYAIFGDDAFPMLFQNMKESFARTCLEIIAEGRPFNEVLTTQTFMMTTALKSLYMQIEMPYDIHTMTFKVNQGARPPLAESVDPNSPNYLVFGYAKPTTSSGKVFSGTCAGDSTKVSQYPGSTYLFQLLLGVVNRDTSNNSPGTTNLGCMEHATQPYFTPQDLSDWQMVTIANTGTPIKSYDLPALRASGATLASKLQRVSFFTTPAFLSVWNTNDSNQHRVTTNQALLVALGQGFTSAEANITSPPSTVGLDGQHAVTGTVCYSCHQSLDPMRTFFSDYYDFNDQVNGTPTTGGSFGFGDVAQDGQSLVDFGKLISMVTDTQVAGTPVNRFALAMTQKLCFLANSALCEETDPEVRRVALAFQNANYDYPTLMREMMSSPLVTDAASTATFAMDGVTISIARQGQLCAALSNRLGIPDICQNMVPTPTDVTTAMNRLAGALPSDGFSRGTEYPVTPPDPSLFYRAASELVCEAVAAQVVDAKTGSKYSSSDVDTAIEDMVVKVMGVPDSDPNHAAVVQTLKGHYTAATTTGNATPTSALRSTFSAACQSPTTLSFGI
jgi:hypothetical protein